MIVVAQIMMKYPKQPCTSFVLECVCMCHRMSDVAMSLCGGLKGAPTEITHEKFLQSLVTYDQFCEDPNIMADPNLVVRIGEK